MNDLLPLATLVNFAQLNAEKVLSLGFYFGSKDLNEDGNIAYEWLVSIRIPEGYLRMTNPALKDSCESLIEELQKKGYDITQMTTLGILANDSQVESLILQLQQITIDKVGYLISMSYWPNLPDSDHLWEGDISINSRWDNRLLTQIRASSLYEVCTQLIEPLQQLDPK